MVLGFSARWVPITSGFPGGRGHPCTCIHVLSQAAPFWCGPMSLTEVVVPVDEPRRFILSDVNDDSSRQL